MNKLIHTLFIIGVLIFLCSCKTYYIPVESFKQQFAMVGNSELKEVITRGPAGGKLKYKTYPIDVIKCVDSKGNPVELKPSPSLEVRFTENNNKRTIFYFDLISVTDTSITGGQSRFISSMIKTIPFSRIKKIEIQDGKKNYRYVN